MPNLWLGLKKERDGSFGVPIKISGNRFGLFFEPKGSFCNSGDTDRVKVWDIENKKMFYVALEDVAGLNTFLSLALSMSSSATQSVFRNCFDAKFR